MREEVRCARPLIPPSLRPPPRRTVGGGQLAGGATTGRRRVAHAHPSPAAPQRRAWAAHQPIWWVPCDCAQVAAKSGRCAEARAKMSLTLQAASVEAAARGRAAVEEEGRSRDVALQQVREGGSGGGTREIREYYGSRSHLLFETHVYNLTPASSPLISLHIGHASASSFKASGFPSSHAAPTHRSVWWVNNLHLHARARRGESGCAPEGSSYSRVMLIRRRLRLGLRLGLIRMLGLGLQLGLGLDFPCADSCHDRLQM